MLSLREPVPISHTQRYPASLLTIALKGASRHKVMSAMSTMKAVRAHKRGGPEVVRDEDAPVPGVGASEGRCEVHAAAVTPGELAWDESWVSVDGADRTPVVPSHEFSGVIARVGGDVRSVTPGTQVYGLIDFNHDGAAAEYVSLPQERGGPPAPTFLPCRIGRIAAGGPDRVAGARGSCPRAARRTSVHPGWRRGGRFSGGAVCEGAGSRSDGYRDRRR